MKRASFFSKEMFTRVSWVVITISVIYILINLFVIGGDALVITLTDSLPIPLSIVTTIIAFILWRKFAPKSSGAGMWRWFTLGWGLWAMGEILYLVYAAISEEVPYPSWADGAYIVGYIFLVAALISRVNETPRKFKFKHGLLLLVISLVFVALAVAFVILPLLQNREPGALVVNVLDVLYPTLDLVMLLLATRLLFDFLTRKSSVGWVLLIVGFILMTIADLMYSYTLSFDLYYPEDTVNLITTLGFAIPYNLAYVFWMMGIYRLQVTEEEVIPELLITQPELVENTHVVMFLNRDMTVDEVSANFTPLTGKAFLRGNDMASVLGIAHEENQAVRTELNRNGKFADRPVELRTQEKLLLPAMLSGIGLVDPQRNVTGAIVVLRALSSTSGLDTTLSEYNASIAKQVRVKSNSSEASQVTRFLCSYYLPIFKQLESMVYQHGGPQQGVVFREVLNRKAIESGWDVRVEAEAVIVSGNATPTHVKNALRGLVDFAKSHLGRMTDAAHIENELELVNEQFSEATRDNLHYIEESFKE